MPAKRSFKHSHGSWVRVSDVAELVRQAKKAGFERGIATGDGVVRIDRG